MNLIKRNHYFLLICFLAVVLVACGKDNEPIPEPEEENPPEETNDEVVVFKEGTGGYEVYRIPAIVETKAGTLLAFAEARKKKSNGDSGDIDLVVKKSEDGGKTWGQATMIWDEGANTCGNPVPIVDQQTGKIHLLMTWNHGDDNWSELTSGTGADTRRPYYTWSDDDGVSWNEPREITSEIKHATWDWYGTGPVHGVQLSVGENEGRLVAPCYFTTKENGQRKDYSHVIYSDDHGQSWTMGEPTQSDQVGECTVAELENGTLMLNMRTSAGSYRKYCLSNDGGKTWGEMQTDYALLDPKCQGSLLNASVDGQHLLFFSNAASAERTNMTVKVSFDDGTSWSRKIVIHEGPSAYSDLVFVGGQDVGVFYEGGEGRPYESLRFRKISLNELK